MKCTARDTDMGVDVISSESVVEQLLAESEALLASISSASLSPSPSSCSPPLSPSGDGTQQSTTLTLASSPASAAFNRKTRRNSTRDRLRSELLFLRRHVTELEAEVTTRKRLQSCGSACKSSASHELQPVSAWQRLTQRQKRARTRGEKENRTLHSRVAKHVELIRGIRELLLAHQSASQWRQSYSHHLNNRMLATGWEEAAEFARLKRDALSAFVELDRVLAGNGDSPTPASREDDVFSDAYDDHTQRFVSRLASTRVFPFNVHGTSNAMWRAVFSLFDWSQLLSEEAAHSDRARITAASGFQVVERSDDTYAVKYALTMSVRGIDEGVRVKDVITRFPSDTPGKTVFIWQTALCSSGPGQVAATSHGPSQIRGSGWIVFHTQPEACSSSVMRSIFEFHTPRAGGDDGKDNGTVELMKSWVTLGEACMDNLALEVDKSLL